MDGQAAGRLDEMRERIVASRRRKLYQDIVVDLFESGGDLTPEGIQARFDARWVEPTPELLAALVAAKVRAAVEHSAAQVEQAREGDRLSKEKVARVREWTEEVLRRVEADAVDTSSIPIAEAELAEFQALAVLVADTLSAPSGESHVAGPGVATTTRKGK